MNFTSSPAQVRFFDAARSGSEGGWSEWRNLPFPGGESCQTGDVADTAEVRLRPGLDGVRIFVGQKPDGRLKIAVNEGSIITVEGVGRLTVKVNALIDKYDCELVLIKK